MFNMINDVQNFIKSNYEQGTYFEAQKEYQNWQNNYDQLKSYTTDKTSDYQLGYQKAQADYQKNQTFHYYPSYLINFANRVSDNRLSEVSEFLKGYHDFKNELLKTKSHH